jgi:hypothetical protein
MDEKFLRWPFSGKAFNDRLLTTRLDPLPTTFDHLASDSTLTCPACQEEKSYKMRLCRLDYLIAT